jgi:hypothetical protein
LSGTRAIAQLRRGDLTSLAAALRTRRLSPPFSPVALSRIIGGAVSVDVSTSLQNLFEAGCSVVAMGAWLEILSEASSLRPQVEDLATLVMTGPVSTEAIHRDTRVVVSDLFRRAERSVVIAGYAIHQGKQIFQELGTRMEDLQSLNVRLYLNLSFKAGDTRSDSEKLRISGKEFLDRHWPSSSRIPEVYYDRRGLEAIPSAPISFHSKCVILDERELFVSSANFTEAAQNRNVEMGVLLNSPILANQALSFFAELVRAGICVRAV